MGWTFNLASGLVALSEGYTSAAVGSEVELQHHHLWFVFTMVGEMALTLLAFRHAIRRDLLVLLGLQTVVMFLTPTALTSQLWETYTVYLEAAVMTGVVVFAFSYARRRKEPDRALTNYLVLFISRERPHDGWLPTLADHERDRAPGTVSGGGDGDLF